MAFESALDLSVSVTAELQRKAGLTPDEAQRAASGSVAFMSCSVFNIMSGRGTAIRGRLSFSTAVLEVLARLYGGGG